MEREGRRMIHIGSVGVVSGGRVVVVAVVGSRASTHGAVHKWFLPRTKYQDHTGLTFTVVWIWVPIACSGCTGGT